MVKFQMVNLLRLNCMTDKQKDIQYTIDKNNCWNVISHYKYKGYCTVKINDKGYRIHRLVYEEFNDITIPKGLVIIHTCDNPSCINPDHLRMGTQKDNIQDCINKGRTKHDRGEKCGSSKLTDNQVLEIIELLKDSNLNQREISKIYNISCNTIQDINKRKTWKHLYDNDEFKFLNERRNKGEKCGVSKLTEKQVLEIKDLLKEGKLLQREIGELYNITRYTISDIKNKKSWKHLN